MAKQQKNKKLEKIAQKVLDNVKQPDTDDHGIDPITIILVISVILTLIRVVQECRKQRNLLKNQTEAALLLKRDIQDIIIKDSWFNRRRLKKIIKNTLSSDQYGVYGTALQNSIMETGVNLTDEEVYTLMEASNA